MPDEIDEILEKSTTAIIDVRVNRQTKGVSVVLLRLDEAVIVLASA